MTAFAIAHVQVTVPVGGEEGARAFYGDLVGLAEVPRPPTLAERTRGAWFALGALQFHIEEADGFVPSPKAHVAISVADFGGLRARLGDAGTSLSPTFQLEGRNGFFAYDPFGNWIEFVEAGTTS